MAKHGSMFRLTITIIIVMIILSYVAFNTRLIIKGPVVEIYDLKDGQIFTDTNLIEIKGIAKNISFISLNDRPIFIDENNNFKEEYLMTNMVNPIEVYAKDKFGKETVEKLTLIYKGEKKEIEIPENMMGTSTDATTTATSSEEMSDI